MDDRSVITLKDHFDEKLQDLEEKLQVRFDLTDKAVANTAESLQNKLDDMNQFRAQITEERLLYARRDEVDLKLCAIEDKMDLNVNTLKDKLDDIASKVVFNGGKSAGKEYAIGIFIALALGISGLIINIVG